MGPLLGRFGKVKLAPPGGDVIGARRIDTHFEGLSALGAKLDWHHIIEGRVEKARGSEIVLDEPSVTATENIIMMAVLCEGKTVIHNAASEPHVVGLCEMLISMVQKLMELEPIGLISKA